MNDTNWMVEIKNCKNEAALLKIVQYISTNQKKLRIDESEMQRLEDEGMRKYESFQRERNALIRNKKQGFNNFN